MIELSSLPPVATPEAWEAQLRARATHYGLEHIDLLIDQASAPRQAVWKRRPLPLNPPQALLKGTLHHDATSTGPLLLRLELEADTQSKALLAIAQSFQRRPKLLVLISDWDFAQLTEHLRYYLLAQWDGGMKKGVLRYYDPRVFQPVVRQLDTPDRQHLLGAGHEWLWIDRDGQSMALRDSESAGNPWRLPRADALMLRQVDIDLMSAWHQAELYRQEHFLTAKDTGQPSEEAMMARLAQIQLAADREQLLSQPQRQAFIRQQLPASQG
jgi:hypothetical protein